LSRKKLLAQSAIRPYHDGRTTFDKGKLIVR